MIHFLISFVCNTIVLIMKIFTLIFIVCLTCSKKYLGDKVSKEFDDSFADANCPKGCSLCTNGTGMNSQCTACMP